MTFANAIIPTDEIPDFAKIVEALRLRGHEHAYYGDFKNADEFTNHLIAKKDPDWSGASMGPVKGPDGQFWAVSLGRTRHNYVRLLS